MKQQLVGLAYYSSFISGFNIDYYSTMLVWLGVFCKELYDYIISLYTISCSISLLLLNFSFLILALISTSLLRLFSNLLFSSINYKLEFTASPVFLFDKNWQSRISRVKGLMRDLSWPLERGCESWDEILTPSQKLSSIRHPWKVTFANYPFSIASSIITPCS